MAREKISEMCHFSISGEFLTRHVRDLMLEGNWVHALKTLTEGLIQVTPDGPQGISVESCILILQGKARLEGDNEVDFVMEEAGASTEYIRELGYVYGCIVRVKEATINSFKWYMPYARVTNFGQNDIDAHYGTMTGYTSFVRRSYPTSCLNRASYYMDDRTNDLAFYPEQNDKKRLSDIGLDPAIAYLFTPCEAPPFWMPYIHDYTQSIILCNEYFRTLEERGDHQLQLSTDEMEKRSAEFQKKYRQGMMKRRGIDIDEENDESGGDIGDSFKSKMLADMVEKTGLDARCLSDMLDVIHGDVDEESAPEEGFIRDDDYGKSGYVLPDGRFYGCGYYQHCILFPRIMKHVLKQQHITQNMDVEKEADLRNFLRIQRSADGVAVQFIFPFNKKLTRSQKETVRAYCKHYSVPLPDDLIDRD
jgi:hypothetical protein